MFSIKNAVFVVAVLVCSPLFASAEAPEPVAKDAAAQSDGLVLELDGLSCQSCVDSITGALKAVPGVTDAVVTLEPQRAVVKLEAKDAPNAEQLIKVVTDLGYSAKLAAP